LTVCIPSVLSEPGFATIVGLVREAIGFLVVVEYLGAGIQI